MDSIKSETSRLSRLEPLTSKYFIKVGFYNKMRKFFAEMTVSLTSTVYISTPSVSN
jgi:hypothetical protein